MHGCGWTHILKNKSWVQADILTPQWWDRFGAPASPHKPRFEKVKKEENKMRPASSPEVETLIGFCKRKNVHTCSRSRAHTDLSNASAALRKPFLFSSSITARPYLIHFKQRCLLWWISNVRELENYYLDLAVFRWLANRATVPARSPRCRTPSPVNCPHLYMWWEEWTLW